MLKDIKNLIDAVSTISPNGLVALALVVVLVAIISTSGLIRSKNR